MVRQQEGLLKIPNAIVIPHSDFGTTCIFCCYDYNSKTFFSKLCKKENKKVKNDKISWFKKEEKNKEIFFSYYMYFKFGFNFLEELFYLLPKRNCKGKSSHVE